MSASGSPVLIVVRRPQIAAEAIAVAEALSRVPPYRPVLAIASSGFDYIPEDLIGKLELVGFSGEPIRQRPAKTAGGSGSGRLRAFANRLSNRVPLLALAMSVRAHAEARASVRNLLDHTQPTAIVVFDDRGPGHPMMLLHEAKRRGIPSVLVPFAASTVESDLLIRSAKTRHRVDKGLDLPFKRLFARLMPNHELRTPHGRFLFFPWPTMAALRLYGLHETRPWVMGGGETSFVGLFDAEEKRELTTHGVDPQRLGLIGQPTTDALFRGMQERDRLRAELGAAPDKPIVICAVPQTAEHGMTSWAEHNRDIDGLFQALGDSGASVLLSLHPKSSAATYQTAADSIGARILERPLAGVLPVADIFVAGFSSTVRWAAALGIPTIVADLSHFRYAMYDMLPAIPKVESTDLVAEHLRCLVHDRAFRERIGTELRQQAAVYATLDGRVGERLVAALNELTGQTRSKDTQIPADQLSEGLTP